MRRARTLLILALGVALVAVIGIWVGSRNPPNRTWVLADGTEFTLMKVTYGKNHRAIDGGWRDLLYPAIPEAVRKKLKWQVGNYGPTTNDALVAWLKVVRLHPGTNQASGPIHLGIATMDENGTESGQNYCQFGASSGPCAVELRNYPRRSKEMTLRFYDTSLSSPGDRQGDFKMPNPSPSQTVPWVAEALPASRETNGLTISLLKLQTGLIDMWVARARPRTNGEGGKYSCAIFDLCENGERASNWKVSSVSASSSSGEQFNPDTYGGNWDQEGFAFNFQGALWQEEPAWKLAVEAWRTGNFPTQELWTVRGIPVPKSQEVVEVHAQTNIYGVQAEILGLGGPGAKMPNAWGYVGSDMKDATLRVRLVAPPRDVHVSLVEVRDDQGKKLEAAWVGTSGSDYGFLVVIPDNAKTLAVTLAVSKSRAVEFLVKPDLMK